jgi:hypothetical protein
VWLFAVVFVVRMWLCANIFTAVDVFMAVNDVLLGQVRDGQVVDLLERKKYLPR